MENFGVALPLRNQYFILRATENFSEKSERYVAKVEACLLDQSLKSEMDVLGEDESINKVNIRCTPLLRERNLGQSLDSGGFDGCSQRERWTNETGPTSSAASRAASRPSAAACSSSG
jgi:hypothetical protein